MISVNQKPVESDKQLIFAEQYLANNRNATAAYKSVYGEHLNDNTAAVNASKLLRTTKISNYLKNKLDVLELNSDYVLRSLKGLAEGADSESVKLQAIIAIGKTLGMFNNDNQPSRVDLYAIRSAYVNYYVDNIMFNPYQSNTKN